MAGIRVGCITDTYRSIIDWKCMWHLLHASLASARAPIWHWPIVSSNRESLQSYAYRKLFPVTGSLIHPVWQVRQLYPILWFFIACYKLHGYLGTQRISRGVFAKCYQLRYFALTTLSSGNPLLLKNYISLRDIT